MKKAESDDCFVANNAEELLTALNVKPDYILITRHYKEEFLENTETPMPEENYFSGTRVAAGTPLYHLLNLLSKKDKRQKRIDGKVQRYLQKKHGEDILLALRQLYY